MPVPGLVARGQEKTWPVHELTSESWGETCMNPRQYAQTEKGSLATVDLGKPPSQPRYFHKTVLKSLR